MELEPKFARFQVRALVEEHKTLKRVFFIL
jgi:hypothetical protein